jgi:hypothetical protein
MASLRKRLLSFTSVLALAASSLAGCADQAEGDADTAQADITSVDHSSVKRQSIGNCWIYATTSWLEALHRAATNDPVDISESYLTYWHWFDQVIAGEATAEIGTGGGYYVAVDIISRYGLMKEGDFLPSEAEVEMSTRQQTALDAMNASLKSGVLADRELRKNREVVRKELNRAWGLDANVVRRIDAVFGAGVERTLDSSFDAFAASAENRVIHAMDFDARLKDPATGQFVVKPLAEALGLGVGTSPLAWKPVEYPTASGERRAFWKRVQRALHDEQPVLVSWKIDFNALRRDSVVSMSELTRRGPGVQGDHMTVMHDYQAEVPGLGLLPAGQQATPAQMEAALADGTTIQFVRVKNSWGGLRPDRWDVSALPGYHDLELAYLDGPIKQCEVDASGHTDPARCTREATPLIDVVLPAGY